jgi:HSP20 family protein
MNLIKFNSFLPLSAQFGGTDPSFLNRSLGEMVGSDNVNEIPEANVIERNDAYEIEVAAPGFSKEDFEVTIENDRLMIRGKKQQEEEMNGGIVKRREFKTRSFKRSFLLKDEIDSIKIEAHYLDGILKVGLPKKVKGETSNRIQVS